MAYILFLRVSYCFSAPRSLLRVGRLASGGYPHSPQNVSCVQEDISPRRSAPMRARNARCAVFLLLSFSSRLWAPCLRALVSGDALLGSLATPTPPLPDSLPSSRLESCQQKIANRAGNVHLENTRTMMSVSVAKLERTYFSFDGVLAYGRLSLIS